MTYTIPDQAPRARRMARPVLTDTITLNPATDAPQKTCKLAVVEALLSRTEGATIAELMAATGWQQHSVRGAVAGAIKKRGWTITSEKVGGVRQYRASKIA